MPLITPDEACATEGPSSTACVARDNEESARRTLSAKTCNRIFENQEVLQTACISSCRSYTSGDGQDCAFAYSRSLHDVALEQSGPGVLFWFLPLLALLAGVAAWKYLTERRKLRALDQPQ